MEVAPGDSKDLAGVNAAGSAESRLALREAELRRMRLFATGLLVLMFAVYVATGFLVDRHPWLDYVRAFSEAGMVGASADWFAVVALFRHPFGIPIPHTAIVARNKARIGDSLGSFICNNFLAPEVVTARLASLDIAGRICRWLGEPANAAFVARRTAGLLPPILEALEEEHVRGFVGDALRRSIGAVDAAPLASRVLSVMMAHGHHQALFDGAIEAARDFLIRNEDVIRAKVAAKSYRWLPRWVDQRLGDRMLSGLMETLAEMRDPDHPWRGEFLAATEGLVDRLATDPQMRVRAETIKAEVAASAAVGEYLDALWAEVKGRLKTDIAGRDGVLRSGVETALLALARRLDEDKRMQAIINHWIARAMERHVVPHRDEIGTFIAGVVARWDTRTLVTKLELQVGKDLQYIRINGTLVGGLVGLAIHAVSKALAG